MSLIAGIIFSVVAAGNHLVVQSAAKLGDAADSIEQKSKPANEAHPRTVKFSGEVLKGRSFEKQIGANLFFRLIPQELGWTIFMGSKAGAENNFCGVVTPPYRGVNHLYIEGWHFRNEDNSGPNEVGPKNVNAPQEVREFYFVLSDADYHRAFDALQVLLWSYAHPKQRINWAENVHAKLPKGSGTLIIRDLKLNTLEFGKQAGIDRMTFTVLLKFR